MAEDPLVSFLETIDPAQVRVISFPLRIWVFGGALGGNTMRDVFWNQSLNPKRGEPWIQHLERPEDFEDWWAFSGYDDLLLFERDACLLARLVVLFAESPGAFAELGAFALDKAITKKLVVILAARYRENDFKKSFLTLGPLKRLQNIDEDAVCVVGSHLASSLEAHDIEGIFSSVTRKISTLRDATHILDIDDPSHRLLIMADIIDLLIVSTESDVQRALHFLGFPTAALSDSKRHAKLLNFLNLAHLRERGNERYLVRIDDSRPLASYTGSKEQKFDRLNFKIRRQEFIDKDARLRAILERPG